MAKIRAKKRYIWCSCKDLPCVRPLTSGPEFGQNPPPDHTNFGKKAPKMLSRPQYLDLRPQPRAFQLPGGVEPVSRPRRPRKTSFYPVFKVFVNLGSHMGQVRGVTGQNWPKLVEKSVFPNWPNNGF